MAQPSIRLLFVFACTAGLLGFAAPYATAQTGKIAGTVTDSDTGETLPGVNVIIDGTTIGATTDTDGFYTILNVQPGSYVVRASFIGYAPGVVQNVRVNINLTTEVDFALQQEAVGLDEVIVVAAEPVVKRDISANVVNLNAEELADLATTASVADVIGLQAGAEGLSIRGGGLDELNFQVDGLSLRDGRTNDPFTGISFTAIEAVQVQTGGFNAEYGNVRSGLVNVVTKEGARDRFSVDALLRYSPPGKNYFNDSPSAFSDYWSRPFLDPAVAFVGTHAPESPWDIYDQRQYPSFQGFNSLAGSADFAAHDLSPGQLQQIWQYLHRKDFDVEEPDYEVDGTISGPVPLLSQALGNLRFAASYRQTQNAYTVPMARDAYKDRTGMLKLTTNVGSGMKLNVFGMLSSQRGHEAGFAGIAQGGLVACCVENSLFADHKVSQTDIDRNLVGVDFTHTLSANTFYQLTVQRNETDYLTVPGRERDSAVVANIGGFPLTEAPFGWQESYVQLFGFAFGAHELATHYDTSNTKIWSGKFDLTSQINRYLQVKTGAQYMHNDQEVNYANFNAFFTFANSNYRWFKSPVQTAAYVQGKLEFQGLVANVGLRLDHFSAGSWFEIGDPYDPNFSAANGGAAELDDRVEETSVDPQFFLSPRLGVSFPIRENSKLFFNYGHFRQTLDPNDIYLVQDDLEGGVSFFGNPRHPMPLTVSYELGYEHSLLDRYLIRATGYYKALEDQPRPVFYQSIDNFVHYSTSEPLNYEDIRGFELSLQKNRGRYLRGFANYTYMVRKEGNFGFSRQLENRRDQREFERQTLENLQFTPRAEPFARVNVELISPSDFGPKMLGVNPLGGWHVSWLGSYRAGNAFTWTNGQQITGIQHNVRWRDYYNLDLRLSKDFEARSIGSVTFFMDVSNLLNRRYLWGGSFIGPQDFEDYMRSLHLSEDTFEGIEQPPGYRFIPGDDRPGTFRDDGVEFVPIEVVDALPATGMTRSQGRIGPLYYVEGSDTWHVWNGSSFEAANQDVVDQVLEDKAYIDMPNMRAFRFLNPRNVRLGFRISF